MAKAMKGDKKMAGILDAIKGLFGKKNKAPATVDGAKDKVEDLVDDVKDKLPDLGSFFDSIMGKLPIDGELGDQVNEVIGSVRSSAPEGAGIGDIANKIIDALKGKFPMDGEIGEKIKMVIEFIKSKIPM